MHEKTVLCCNTLQRSVNVLLKEYHVSEHVKVKHLVVSVEILILSQLSVRANECMRIKGKVNF